jgi:hypothetical protein
MPRATKRAPTSDLRRRGRTVMDRSFFARTEVKSAKITSITVPLLLNNSPRKRKLMAGCAAVGETNCGRQSCKDKKPQICYPE